MFQSVTTLHFDQKCFLGQGSFGTLPCLQSVKLHSLFLQAPMVFLRGRGLDLKPWRSTRRLASFSIAQLLCNLLGQRTTFIYPLLDQLVIGRSLSHHIAVQKVQPPLTPADDRISANVRQCLASCRERHAIAQPLWMQSYTFKRDAPNEQSSK